MTKYCVLVALLKVYLLSAELCSGILLSNEEQPKPAYTAGIKTAHWKNPNSIQTHHNYSKVYVHNNPEGPTQYVVTQSEKTQRVYPIYNAHAYNQSPGNQQRVIEINSQLGHNWTAHGKNIGGDTKNRTIYKRKIEFKTLEIYEKCPEGATGQFVYHLSCNQFLNCWKGRGEAQNCAPGTLFNPKTLECDFPDKVECITGPRQNTLTDSRVPKSISQVLCPKEFSGLIPNYTDCSKFISCNNGLHTPMDCPPGTLFDINQNVCDFPYKSTCFNGQSSVQRNGSEYGAAQQNLNFGQSGQYYHGQSGQYHNQNAYGLNQYSGQGQQQGTHSGGYYQTTYGRQCNPQTQICSYPTNKPSSTGQQFYQTQYGSTGNKFNQNTDQSGLGYQGHTSQFYQTHYSPTTGGSATGAAGHGQSGQTYHRQDGQYYQTHYGSSATGVDSGNSDGNQDINSKLDFGSHQTGCSGPTCGRPSIGTQYSNTQNQNHGQTRCRLGEQNCGQNVGQHSYSHTIITGQASCNPRIQNCGSQQTTSQSYGYNGDRNFGGTQQSATSQAQGQFVGVGQQNYNKICNINDRNCHQGHVNTATTTNTRKSKEPKCPDGFQGITKHPSDCKKFLNCANGLTFIQDCAPGTLFNPTIGNCDFPYNVVCNNTDEVTDTTTDSSDNGYNTENWQTTYHEHAQQYGQNAGHGNIRQNPTETSQTQHGGHGTYQYGQGQVSQNQGRYEPQRGQSQGHGTQGVHIQHQRPPSQGTYTYTQEPGNYGQGYNAHTNQGSNGNYGQGYNAHTNQGSGSSKPITLIPAQGTNHLGRGDGDEQIRDTNRGQIGILTRPVYPQTQDSRRQNLDDQKQQNIDYVDVFDPAEQKNYAFRSTTPKSLDKSWPPPFPSTDTNADYVFEYDDGEPVTLEPESVFYADKKKKSTCGKGDFHCSATMCISKTMVCDGHRDCANGKDELGCQEYLQRFTLRKNSHLDVLEKQRWINVSHTTCALLCIENTKFDCRSFNYRKIDKTCFLTDSNIGLSGALMTFYPSDYYELRSATVDCANLYKCRNNKCIRREQLCDGFDDCGDRQDEKNCKSGDFGYKIRLAGSRERNEGRVEITAFGKTGYICDDQFGIRDANVICRELGFQLGAADIKGNSYYARDLKESNTLYMMDDLDCFGNETTLLDCGFPGWGVHNCRDQEIAGVVCKTPQEKCGAGYWKCDTGNECVPFSFVCDGLMDCSDDSDEGVQHCEAPTEIRLVNGTSIREGRVEIKHHGVWGTVCDDDFNEDAAKVVCKYLGFRGTATVKKEAYFGSGEGPIWLDQVACYGDETELQKCTHWNWGEHNCDHGEDVGVICSNENHIEPAPRHSNTHRHGFSTLKPATISCGFRKDNQFLENDLIHARVVSGSLARKGDYPWQAALRVKGKGKSAHWCGAVIISSSWVLTAAHCLEGYAKGAYIVVAGEYNTDEDEGTEQQKYIEDYFIHEKFRKGHKMNNDVALIKVKGGGFRLSDDVQPICLPDEDADYERELNCTISGFGSVKSGTSAYSHNMMAAWIPIHNDDTCKMPHVYGNALTEGMICAGFLDGGIDACDGDSGGPLACLDDGLFTLYGLTSWGQHCGYANKPGVYVKVAHYRKWIDDIIKAHS